jgi:hypothetical protein
LVFSNGVIVLSVLAAALVYAFDANLTALIQLYVVGVFTAFTLSQAGMVRRWQRLREPGWRRGMTLNALGATATGVVLVIVTVTKFVHGAWIVIAAMPVLILVLLAVNRHYRTVGRALRARRVSLNEHVENTFVLLVPDLGLATADAVGYVRALRPERVVPVFFGDPGRFEPIARRWPSFAPRMGDLMQLPENGNRIRTLRTFLRSLQRDPDDAFVTVVVPEDVTNDSIFHLIRRRSRFWLKVSLLFESGVVVTNVPLVPEERPLAAMHAEQPVEPLQSVVLVPVSAVHAATARAVAYATSLNAAEVEAVYFVLDPEQGRTIADEWIDWRMTVPLSIVEAPFRDITNPMLEEIRKHTSRPGTVVTVVLPELIVRHTWEHLLHNQTALFLKRLLLVEPNVVVTSVPFHLAAAARP